MLKHNTNHKNQLKDHLDYLVEVERCINNKKYHELMTFTNFSLCILINSNVMCPLLESDKKVIKHIFNNLLCTNFVSNDGWSLVHYLIIYLHDDKIFRYLVEKNKLDIGTPSKCGTQPLHFLCYGANDNALDIIKYLMDRGIDLECENEYHRRPIHNACVDDKVDLVEFFINHGVDLECETSDGRRPIHIACQNNSIHAIKLLIDKGVDLQCCDMTGNKPIHMACSRQNSHLLVKMLIDKKVDLECLTNVGNKPIHHACRYGSLETIKLLVENGADIESINGDGLKPIHLICWYGDLSSITYFLSITNIDLDTKINISAYDNPYEWGIEDFLLDNWHLDDKDIAALQNKYIHILKM